MGPIMVGPSSSHTAGALKIAKYARQKLGSQPVYTEIILYNSFAKTYKGHGTDVALIGGILDFEADDLRIPSALLIAKETGINFNFILEIQENKHPNTVKLTLNDAFRKLEVEGKSIGGGSFKIISEKWL